MYNPINRVIRSTKETGSLKHSRSHWLVSWLEVISFLSFLPGMFIFLYTFILSAAALFATFEIAKGRYTLAISVFIIFNVIPGLLGMVSAFSGGTSMTQGVSIAVLYGGIGLWGVAASIVQKRVRIYAS